MTALLKFCPLGVMALLALAGTLAAGGDIQAQQKQPPPKKADDAAKKAAKEQLKASLAEALRDSYILLASASYDYGTHKGKAVKAVQAALNLVNANTLKDANVQKGVKALREQNAAFAKAMAWEGRTFHDHHHLADFQLAQAAAQLRQIYAVLHANQKPTEAKHVQTALESINTALTVEAPKRVAQQLKGKEALALAEAWILLAAADHKDRGQRHKAMKSVSNATAVLDANLAGALSTAPIQQRVQSIRDNNAALATALASDGDAEKIKRYIAQVQIFEAAAISAQVGRILVLNKQQYALAHVEQALKEMDLSLSTGNQK